MTLMDNCLINYITIFPYFHKETNDVYYQGKKLLVIFVLQRIWNGRTCSKDLYWIGSSRRSILRYTLIYTMKYLYTMKCFSPFWSTTNSNVSYLWYSKYCVGKAINKSINLSYVTCWQIYPKNWTTYYATYSYERENVKSWLSCICIMLYYLCRDIRYEHHD